MQKSHRKSVAIMTVVVVLMFGFSFALVPLYRVACKALGINTSVPANELSKAADPALDGKSIDTSRDLTVQFVAIMNQGLLWDFHPQMKAIKIHPGASTKVLFYAKNNTDKEMIVQAIPSMTPVEAISHFHKIECFCFNKQTLKAGESKNMALVFQVDKNLPKDVHTITLAYTLFDVTSQAAKKELG